MFWLSFNLHEASATSVTSELSPTYMHTLYSCLLVARKSPRDIDAM